MAYRRAEHVAWRRIAGETVLVDLKAKQIFGLNESGGKVWHALPAHDALSTALPVEEGLPSVAAFLGHLRDLGLVVADEGSGSHAPLRATDRESDFPVPPLVVWKDEIRNFAASCLHQPGVSDFCNQKSYY